MRAELRQNARATSKSRRRPGRPGPWLAGALAIVLAATGCRKSSETPPPSSEDGPDRKPPPAATLPAVPGQVAGDAGSDELVTDDVQARFEKPFYEMDDKVPAGTLRGICWVRTRRPSEEPRGERIDLTEGPLAIKNPTQGELKFFRKWKPRKPVWHAWNRQIQRMGLIGAAIVIPNVRKGRRQPVQWRGASFRILNGRMNNWGGARYTTHIMKFVLVKDLIRFVTYDPCPSHFVLTEVGTGEVVCERPMAAYMVPRRGDVGSAEAQLGHAGACSPIFTRSMPLTKLHGIYKFTDRRHPWIEAYAVIVNSPYVATTGQHGPGQFAIDGIPAGKWSLWAWHPRLVPVRKTQEFEIRKDEVTEIAIEFKPPVDRQK